MRFASVRFERLFTAVLVCAAMIVAACAHRTPVTDPALLGQLGFLQPGKVTRNTVEARIGLPAETFEGGLVVTYSVFEKDGHLTTMPSSYDDRRYTLVLQYKPDGVLVRRSLVRAP